MAVPRSDGHEVGEKSECFDDPAVRSVSPRVNRRLCLNPPSKLYLKSQSAEPMPRALPPDAFRARPRISRTPPISEAICTEGASAGKIQIHITCDGQSEDNGRGTYQSSRRSISFNSPSLSIEYGPGSSRHTMQKRSKFQFKKSHYQRFCGTSSARKTNEIRKAMLRDERSRSDSLVSSSAPSMAVSFPDNCNFITFSKHNALPNPTQNAPSMSTLNPSSPPSDKITHGTRGTIAIDIDSGNEIVISNVADSASVSSPPSPSSASMLDTKTQSQLHSIVSDATTEATYSYRYRGRQQRTARDANQPHQCRVSSPQQHSTDVSCRSPTVNSCSAQKQCHTFGSASFAVDTTENDKVDPDAIRLALRSYRSNQSGQSLEELFKRKSSCLRCAIL